MKRKKTVLILTLVMLISLSIIFIPGCTKQEKSQKGKIVKVGAAIALTGYGASFGEVEKNVITILREKIGEQNVQFFLEDTKSNPKDGVVAVNKLLMTHDVDIIYTDLSTIARAISPIVLSKKKILIAVVYLTDLLENNKYAIRNLPTGEDESKLLLEYLKSKGTPLDNIAALISNDEFGNACLDGFQKQVSMIDGKIVYSNTIPDNLNIKNEVLKIIELKPEVIYIGSLLSHVGHVIKELRLAGFEGKIITTDAFAYPYIHNAAGDHANGTIYVDFPTNSERYHRFENNYKERFKKDLTPVGVLFHDAVSCITESYIKANSKDLDAFFVGIYNLGYDGIYGKVVLMNREFKYPLEVKIWGPNVE